MTLEYYVKVEESHAGQHGVTGKKVDPGSSSGGWGGSGKSLGGARTLAMERAASLTSEQQAERASVLRDEAVKSARFAEVCGLLKTIRIVNARLTEDFDGKMHIEEQSTRYKSMQAWNLGRWIAYAATHPIESGNERDREEQAYVQTRTALYLQQDLYCLSSDAAATAWPDRGQGHTESRSDEQKQQHHHYIDSLHTRMAEKDAVERLKASHALESSEIDAAKAQNEKLEVMYSILHEEKNEDSYLEDEQEMHQQDELDAGPEHTVVMEHVGEGLGVSPSEAMRVSSPLTLEVN